MCGVRCSLVFSLLVYHRPYWRDIFKQKLRNWCACACSRREGGARAPVPHKKVTPMIESSGDRGRVVAQAWSHKPHPPSDSRWQWVRLGAWDKTRIYYYRLIITSCTDHYVAWTSPETWSIQADNHARSTAPRDWSIENQGTAGCCCEVARPATAIYKHRRLFDD